MTIAIWCIFVAATLPWIGIVRVNIRPAANRGSAALAGAPIIISGAR